MAHGNVRVGERQVTGRDRKGELGAKHPVQLGLDRRVLPAARHSHNVRPGLFRRRLGRHEIRKIHGSGTGPEPRSGIRWLTRSALNAEKWSEHVQLHAWRAILAMTQTTSHVGFARFSAHVAQASIVAQLANPRCVLVNHA